MDRLFILQSSYVNSRHNPDGLIYKHLLGRYKLQNLDDICETDSAVSNTAFETAKKRNWKIIPVGTVEFVQEWLYMMNPSAYMTPIEIPEEIWYLADREYSIMKGKEIPKEKKTEEYFIKDADHLKRWNNLLYFDENEIEPDTLYVVSKRIWFESEYRIFVYRGEIVAIQNYLGDPTVLPNGMYIRHMVEEYERKCRHPKSYTMDIGITKGEDWNFTTHLIEIHPFAACGLYGLYDKCVCDMLEDGISWYLDCTGDP